MSDKSDSKEQKISTMLQQGLEFYGTGEDERAFALWVEVLELDPGNEEALDYMRDADRRVIPRGESRETGDSSIVEEALRLLGSNDEEAALEFLTNSSTGDSLESEAMIELLRAKLFRHYRGELGDLSQVARIVPGSTDDLEDLNLTPSAGFLLSVIDGTTALGDLVSQSGMDRFEALRSLSRMHKAGLVRWETS